MLKLRHVTATTGRLPTDPVREPFSGVIGGALGLAVPQAREGHAVQLWGWNDAVPAQRTRWNGVEIWTSPDWPWARFARWDVRWLAPMWRRALTQASVDVLHAHVDPTLLFMPRARVRLLHLQTPVPNPLPPAYRRVLQRAGAVTCCSDFIRRQFLASSDFPADRTFVVHNGADRSLYRPELRRAQRERWGIRDDQFVAFYAGAIVPEKGVEHLVRAFAAVQAEAHDAVLILAGGAKLWATPGGNPEAEAYEDRVRGIASGLNVRFVGALPRGEMPGAFLAADTVVIPSVWDEPHALVVCEAMAAGRPVVASTVGGIPETVANGHSGILVAPGDERGLAEAIARLALDPALRERMAGASLERADLFTWEASATRLDGIYRQLLAAGPARGHVRTSKETIE